MNGQRVIDGLEDALAYMNGSATKEDYEMHSTQAISLEDFEKVEVRVGTVLEVTQDMYEQNGKG